MQVISTGLSINLCYTTGYYTFFVNKTFTKKNVLKMLIWPKKMLSINCLKWIQNWKFISYNLKKLTFLVCHYKLVECWFLCQQKKQNACNSLKRDTVDLVRHPPAVPDPRDIPHRKRERPSWPELPLGTLTV